MPDRVSISIDVKTRLDLAEIVVPIDMTAGTRTTTREFRMSLAEFLRKYSRAAKPTVEPLDRRELPSPLLPPVVVVPVAPAIVALAELPPTGPVGPGTS